MNAPSLIHKFTPAVSTPSIGSMLVDSGKLSAADAEKILRLQKEKGIRFGEAAQQLGLIHDDEIQAVLNRQYGYPCLRRGQSKISEELVAAYAPHSVQVEGLRALRSQLMLRWFAAEHGSKALAIVSPGRSEGRSHLAANLAVVFSQLGETTLLIDADMRHGRQHQLFNVDNRVGLSTVLSGRSHVAPVLRMADLASLSVLTAGPLPPNPQELLGRDVFAKLMDKFSRMFDVIIVDTPAGDDSADVQILGARTGGALMLARQGQTSLDAAGKLADTLKQVNVSLVGAVLNRF